MSELQKLEEQVDVCKSCGIGRIDLSENDKSCMCRNCREEKIRYPFPKTFYVVVIILIALICMAMVNFPSSIKMYKTYRDVDKNVTNGYVASTLYSMSDLLEKYPDSLKIALKATDIAMEHGYYDYASYFIDTYLVGETLEDATYNKITKYIDKLNTYYDTSDAIEKIFADAVEAAGMEQDDYTAYVQSQLADLLLGNRYDQALIYYTLGYIEPDNAKRLEYMQECLRIDSTYLDATAQIASIYRRQGDLVKARKLLESAYQRNKEDSSILRNLAIVEMLEGNLEQGLIYAESAYKNYPEGDYVADTYITALHINGQVELAKQVKAECEGLNIYLDENLEAFLDGSISLEDTYID